MEIRKENITPFVRVIREVEQHDDGASITSYRESRPWVLAVLGSAMASFCIWLYTVATVASIN